ncbi:MAG: DUF2493 domain-containing protein [Candidatus Pacearchaeota archaeon]|jgi:predicted Rossmann fold nucleotide-binding protein DprA/Smf involved in DNA uptake|nr:DUF2493 domain-containing protein [Clostridia bacterium]
MNLKIAIVGSRSFNDYDKLKSVMNTLKEYYKDHKITVVSGGANGADKLGEKWANENSLETLIFIPSWDDLSHPNARILINKWGKQYDANAGMRRNKDIVDNAHIVIAFWDGVSSGTNDSIKYAKKTKKPLKIFKI